MSPPISTRTTSTLRTFQAVLGTRLNDARRERGWSVQRLATEAGLSRGLVYLALRGGAVSLDAALRMIGALGLKFEWDLVDPKRRVPRPRQDIVHSAMGEFEVRHLRQFHYGLALDEPYQHYQFAGRADLIAWDRDARALLHIENRTRFPDFQEAAGAFSAKRAYVGIALGRQLDIPSWRSETHVMACVWSSEMLHALRLRTESFRTLCPDQAIGFSAWWSGNLPERRGKTSELIVLDPLAAGRQRAYVSLDEALPARPRHAGYAELAARLTGRSTNAA